MSSLNLIILLIISTTLYNFTELYYLRQLRAMCKHGGIKLLLWVAQYQQLLCYVAESINLLIHFFLRTHSTFQQTWYLHNGTEDVRVSELRVWQKDTALPCWKTKWICIAFAPCNVKPLRMVCSRGKSNICTQVHKDFTEWWSFVSRFESQYK